MRITTLAAVAIFVSASFLVGIPQVSAAEGYCGSPGNYFALTQKRTYDQTVYGVRADIQRKGVVLCSAAGGSPDFVSTWNMLIPKTPGDQYAQAGWIKIGADAPYDISGYHVFSEYSKECFPDCVGTPSVFTAGPDPAGTRTYQVYLRASDDRIVMRYGGVELDKVPRDVTGEWSSAWAGQWASEPHRRESDVPGTKRNKLRIYNVRKYNSTGALSTSTISVSRTPKIPGGTS